MFDPIMCKSQDVPLRKSGEIKTRAAVRLKFLIAINLAIKKINLG